MEHRWNETDRGKPKYWGEKPVPVPLCPPQIPMESNLGPPRWKPASKCLSHGTSKRRLLSNTVRRLTGKKEIADSLANRRHIPEHAHTGALQRVSGLLCCLSGVTMFGQRH
jgi:hypothetical protein